MQCCSEDRLACLRRSEVDRSRSQNHFGGSIGCPPGPMESMDMQEFRPITRHRSPHRVRVLGAAPNRSAQWLRHQLLPRQLRPEARTFFSPTSSPTASLPYVAVQIEGNVTAKPGMTGNPQCAAAYASFDQRPSVAFAGKYFETANP